MGATGDTMSVLWTIVIGFVAGIIEKFLSPGNKYEPSGFMLRSQAGAFVLTSAAVAVYVIITTLMVPFATKRPQRPIAGPHGI